MHLVVTISYIEYTKTSYIVVKTFLAVLFRFEVLSFAFSGGPKVSATVCWTAPRNSSPKNEKNENRRELLTDPVKMFPLFQHVSTVNQSQTLNENSKRCKRSLDTEKMRRIGGKHLERPTSPTLERRLLGR